PGREPAAAVRRARRICISANSRRRRPRGRRACSSERRARDRPDARRLRAPDRARRRRPGARGPGAVARPAPGRRSHPARQLDLLLPARHVAPAECGPQPDPVAPGPAVRTVRAALTTLGFVLFPLSAFLVLSPFLTFSPFLPVAPFLSLPPPPPSPPTPLALPSPPRPLRPPDF